MSADNVIRFLYELAGNTCLLDDLKVRSKDDVLAVAAELGMAFSEAEFNDLIWSVEERLAGTRDESFDSTFPLWHLMWGRYYLEYLVVDLVPSLVESKLTPQEV